MMKILFVLLTVLCFASQALAHRLSVFAYEEQGNLQVESFFSGNRPSRNCPVTLTAPGSTKVLAQGKTNDAGKATFPLPAKGGDVQVTVNCGDGHRGEWLYEGLAGEDLAEIKEPRQVPATGNEPSPSSASPLPLADEQLRHIIAQELDKQLAPIRRQLAHNSDRQPSLQDILGGIGYLLGLAGLVTYFRSRRG